MAIDIDQVSADTLDAALWVHRRLGPGLLESVYEVVLAAKLKNRSYMVERQKAVDIEVDEFRFAKAFRIDLLVDRRLLVEVKSVERLTAAHSKQLLTYLRLTNQPVGLLINFGASTLKEGIRRVVNGHIPSATSRLRVNQTIPKLPAH